VVVTKTVGTNQQLLMDGNDQNMLLSKITYTELSTKMVRLLMNP